MHLFLFIQTLLALCTIMSNAEYIPVATAISANTQYLEVDAEKVTQLVASKQAAIIEKNEAELARLKAKNERELHEARLQYLHDEDQRNNRLWTLQNRPAIDYNDAREKAKFDADAERNRLDRVAKQRADDESKKAQAMNDVLLFETRQKRRKEWYLLSSYVAGGVAVGLYLVAHL